MKNLIKSIIGVVGLVNAAGLDQTETNGNSLLGTFDAPVLSALPGSTWGEKTLETTNVYKNSPNTGKLRKYNFDISRGLLAPDGVNASLILVNGAFPGPTIEANWGDTFQITVNNKIEGPEAGTSLHWHGLLQHETPWMDGVPSVTQCPIAPGQSFTYTFKADRPGTSWWHSHYAAQTAGGLHGAMIIHGPIPAGVTYDYDLGPVLLSDHYFIDYRELLQGYLSVPLDLIFSDNNLINGKGQFDCSKTNRTCTPNAGYSKFRFRSGKTHLLRLINTSAEGLQHFTIDGHSFQVIEFDFVPIKRFTTSKVTLSPGQRANILVKGIGKPNSSYWVRSDIDAVCAAPSQPHALAQIYYENSDITKAPNTNATPYTAIGCGTDPLASTVPLYPIAPPANPSTRKDLDITLGFNQTGFLQWYMNNVTFRADMNLALLSAVNNGTEYFGVPEWNVWDFGSNSSIRMLMRNYHISPHPMHLHGHDFWILAEGHGDWDGKIVNPGNPIRRDTHQLLPMDAENRPGYAVIEWVQDNPGVWAFHCHIFSHLSLGFYINVLERPDDVQNFDIPDSVQNTCVQWNAYASKNVVDQPDAGLKNRK